MERILTVTGEAFEGDDTQKAMQVEPLEEVIDVMVERLRDQHIRRLKDGVCSIDTGVVFLDVLNNVERISDHCSNVAVRMVGMEARRGLRLPHPQEHHAPQPHQGLHAGVRAVPQGVPCAAGADGSLTPKNNSPGPNGPGLFCADGCRK